MTTQNNSVGPSPGCNVDAANDGAIDACTLKAVDLESWKTNATGVSGCPCGASCGTVAGTLEDIILPEGDDKPGIVRATIEGDYYKVSSLVDALTIVSALDDDNEAEVEIAFLEASGTILIRPAADVIGDGWIAVYAMGDL